MAISNAIYRAKTEQKSTPILTDTSVTLTLTVAVTSAVNGNRGKITNTKWKKFKYITVLMWYSCIRWTIRVKIFHLLYVFYKSLNFVRACNIDFSRGVLRMSGGRGGFRYRRAVSYFMLDFIFFSVWALGLIKYTKFIRWVLWLLLKHGKYTNERKTT